LPKGIPLSYKSGPKGGKSFSLPAGLEKYFTEVASILKTGQRIKRKLEQEIARRYGQEFLNSLKNWGN